jgi:hypothetical protein
MHIHYLIWLFRNGAREANHLLLNEIVGVTDGAGGVGDGFLRICSFQVAKLDVLLALAAVLDHFELDLHLPVI